MPHRRPTALGVLGRAPAGPTVAAAVLVALVVAVGIRTSELLLIGAIAAVAVGLGALLHRRSPRRPAVDPHQAGTLPSRYRWIPWAWLTLAFVSMLTFSEQPGDGESVARGQALAVEDVVELAAYAAVVLAVVLTRLPGPAPRPAHQALLLAWPAWAVLSSTWSVIPAYSLVRGLQLLVVVMLAVHTARVLDLLGDDGRALARPFARRLVNLCTLLALWGFAFPRTAPVPGGDVAAAAAASERLAWYGVHTLTAATVLGTATVLAAVLGPGFLRLAPAGWAVRVAVLLAGTVATQGRGVLIGLLVAVPVVLWVLGRRRPPLRYLSLGYYGAGVIAAFALYQRQLVELASRGEGLERLFNLNGRLPLWNLALSEIDSLRELLLGFGHAASFVLFYEDVAFAGHAHNSLIDALLGTGVIGAVLLVAWLSVVGRGLGRAAISVGAPDNVRAALTGVLVLLLVNGIGAPGLAFPGFVFSIVGFLAVFALRCPSATGRSPQSDDEDLRSHRDSSRLTPIPIISGSSGTR